MNNSTKTIKKIMLWSASIAAFFGLIYFIADGTGNRLRGFLGDAVGGISGISAAIAIVTFIAFLISLIVASSKGQ